MTDFFNPYQFIEVTGLVDGKPTPTVEFEKIRKGLEANIRHDLWQAEALTGRVVCQLENLSPFLIGMEHVKPSNKQEPVEVRPYRYKNEVRLPANSLRGMTSAIAEALSQSAMRVLSNQAYETSGCRTYDFFDPKFPSSKVNDANVRPWGDPERTGLTPAEALFGVVWDEKEFRKDQEQAHSEPPKMRHSQNLASRVRFSDAVCTKPVTYVGNEPERLKILGSPKPAERPKPGKKANPVPCMYFRNRGNTTSHISKETLAPPLHQANRRKFYLPFNEYSLYDSNNNKRGRWNTRENTDHDNQRIKCRLLEKNQVFYFHIDFENLSKAELGLLLTALNPAPEFIHRLGLGKPLGLGMVKLDIVGVFIIDKVQRYSVQGLETHRYKTAWTSLKEWPKELSGYQEEQRAFGESGHCEPIDLANKFSTSYVDQNTLKALKDLSKIPKDHPKVPICYPFTSSQNAFNEVEGFRWFNQNRRRGDNLSPITHNQPPKPMRS